jgi:hypothetical protein
MVCVCVRETADSIASVIKRLQTAEHMEKESAEGAEFLSPTRKGGECAQALESRKGGTHPPGSRVAPRRSVEECRPPGSLIF